MEKYKRLKATLISLLAATVVFLLSAVFLLGNHRADAYASDRYVSLDGNTVFYTSIHGAEVTHTEKITEGEGEAAKDHYYTLFKITGDQTVSYRQSLAYNWISGIKDEEDKPTGEMDGEENFSMEISFPSLNFKRFIIKFQSQQYELTKDGKSDNYLIFTPSEDGALVNVSASQTLEEEGDSIKGEVRSSVSCDKGAKIKIEFGHYGAYGVGNYPVLINGVYAGIEIKNVSKSFAAYVSSGDNAVTPLTFSAQFKDATDETPAEMVLYDINGQSFEMYEQSTDEFRVKDTASPVICFNKTPSYLEYGESIGFSYRVIDVLASNPGAKVFYYVLSADQYASDTFEYDRTDYTAKTEEGSDEEKVESPFTEMTSTSDARIVRDADTFIPSNMLESNVYGLVKIYYELYDVSYASSSSRKDIVFVDWYAKPEALVNIYGADLKNDGAKESNFLKLIDDKPGVTYAQKAEYEDGDDALALYKADIVAFETSYGEKIRAAIEKQNPEEKKLFAGSDKFYLPAIPGDYFVDDYMTGVDYTYSVYYRAKSTGSNTSLSSNQLAMDLNEADVTYRFTIFITDGFSSTMRYPTRDNDGKIVWEKISADDVWDEEFADLLPYFEVDVSYKEATCENPEDLSLAYVGTNYSGVSFDIKGVSDTYVTSYNLYVFDKNAYGTLTGIDFAEKVDELLKNADTRKYFTTVKASSELLETDANYDDFRALNWNANSVSFTPQSVEDVYVVELTLTDKRSKRTTTNYAVVEASVQTTPLKGESEWLQNNLTSVILFSVAGVCLIALIVLLIVKPKDKGDIDAVYTEVSQKRTGKKNEKK